MYTKLPTVVIMQLVSCDWERKWLLQNGGITCAQNWRKEYDKGKMGGRMLASQCVVGNSGNGRKYVLQSTGIFTGVLRIGVSNLWWFWTWLHMDPDEIWPRVPLKLHQSHANMSISVDGNACSVLSRLFSSPIKSVCVWILQAVDRMVAVVEAWNRIQAPQ